MTFRSHPDPSVWDHYVDYESTSWPKKEKRNYWIVPSICFNCESACGILAYVDKEQLTVRKIEGNPLHPGSRGRTCAKGVVTPNQREDPRESTVHTACSRPTAYSATAARNQKMDISCIEFLNPSIAARLAAGPYASTF